MRLVMAIKQSDAEVLIQRKDAQKGKLNYLDKIKFELRQGVSSPTISSPTSSMYQCSGIEKENNQKDYPRFFDD